MALFAKIMFPKWKLTLLAQSKGMEIIGLTFFRQEYLRRRMLFDENR
jgi:hypothetical protein